MAQRSHVPKFGNWDRENIPYTTFFENARKGRGPGGRIINPNDPEERHELMREEHHHMPPSDGKSSHIVRPPSPTNTSNKNAHTVQQFHQEKKHHTREGGAFVGHMKSPYHDRAYHRDSTNAQRSRKDKSNVTSFGSEESNFSNTSLHSHRSHRQSKDLIEQRYNFLPSMSPQQPTSRTKNNQRVETHHRVASVPKFGAWDVTNAQSGAGFTVIFDKVKEERQNAGNNLPSVLNTPRTYPPDQEISDNKSTKPKMLCCFLPIVG